MHDRPPRILDHLLPVLQLESLAVVPEQNFADGVRGSDAVVVGHDELEVHPLRNAMKRKEGHVCLRKTVVIPPEVFAAIATIRFEQV